MAGIKSGKASRKKAGRSAEWKWWHRNEERSGTGENENRRRLDQMEEVIQSMIALMLEQGKLSTPRHERTLEEIRELTNLQKERHIDVMALFQSQRNLRGAEPS